MGQFRITKIHSWLPFLGFLFFFLFALSLGAVNFDTSKLEAYSEQWKQFSNPRMQELLSNKKITSLYFIALFTYMIVMVSHSELQF